MKTLAVVPARLGSKGVPGKNVRDFMGKPLVSWAIEMGKATCDRVCVTSDDPRVIGIAEGYGVGTLARPAQLADDETPMLAVLQHALACQAEPPDAVVLLQPTQPLRTETHVKAALAHMAAGHDSVVSVVQIPAHMGPDWALRIRKGWLSVPSGPTRRQECRDWYYRDGTVYVTAREVLEVGSIYGRSVCPLVIPPWESCTIDTEADWARAEQMWRQRELAEVV